MFAYCANLSDGPTTLNAPQGTNFTFMFMGCSSLRKLPQLSISNATTVHGLFAGTSIKTVPDLGLSYSNCTDFSQMF